MNRKLFIIVSLFFVMVFGISNVNADESWGLFIFDDSTSTLSFPYSSFKSNAKVGDQIQLYAKVCSYDPNSTSAKIDMNSSSCKDVEVNWSTNDKKTIDLTSSGLINILKENSDGVTVVAETKDVVSETATTVSAAIKLNESYAISSIEKEKSEKVISGSTDSDSLNNNNNNNNVKDEEFVNDFSKDVKTKSNPVTGNNNYLLFIIPILVVGGSVIALKSNKKVQ